MKIADITRQAANQWGYILPALGIKVSDNPKTHTACPACGGKDRFRFDDNGRGSHICNQCGAGDGLELVKKVFDINATEAANRVAEVLGIDYRTAETTVPPCKPVKEPDRQNDDTNDIDKIALFTERYHSLLTQTIIAESDYLKAKGLAGFSLPLLPDGTLLIPLINESGIVTGAQTISRTGEKRLLPNSVKKGSYYPVNAPERVSEVILTEGIATALSVHLMRPDALTIAAIDAGNLLPVAGVTRRTYPDAQIIIAGDNDIKRDALNVGKDAAEKAARSVSGWVTIPPIDYKADWNDYHQQYGLDTARQAFHEGLYQLKAKLSDKQNARPNLSQMAASQRGELLAQQYLQAAINTQSGEVCHYNGEVWQRLTDTDLRRQMAVIFHENQTPYSPTGITNAIEAMKLQVQVMEQQPRHLIGFKNGVFDLQKNAFRSHQSTDWLLNHNGIVFSVAKDDEQLPAYAPHFYKWLHHAANGDKAKMERVNAALFMVLANRYDWQLFLEITGEGGSGKSIFTRIASLLAGEHNTASGSMSALDTARGRAQYVGKSLIILPDQVKYVGEGAGIKAITGGDLIEIDGKYEKQFSTVLTAVVIATNNIPMTFSERNGGIARRRVIFPFDRVVKDSEKDIGLADKIATELPVIIRHLFNTFADQEKAKQLLLAQRNSAEALRIKRETDPVIDMCAAVLFMDTATGLRMGKANDVPRNPKRFLYHLYLEYMDANGLTKPLSVQNFSKAVKSAAIEYGKVYLTRQIKGRTQTNVELTDRINDFLPFAYDIEE